MTKSRGLAVYLLVGAFTAAIGALGRTWTTPALGLPADFWAGFLRASAVIVPLSILGAVYLARWISSRTGSRSASR